MATREILTRVGLVLGSIGLSLMAAECGWRLTSDEVRLTTIRNFAESKLTLFQSAYPATYDAQLGWIPRPGYGGGDNVWGTQVTIDERGMRRNGALPPSGRPVLLAGDSFSFGDEVSDHQTLAARLETRLKRPVWNAGVFGYGLDQTVLRTEAILEQQRNKPDDEKVDTVVIQLVRDDIPRMMMSERTGVKKPYFLLADDRLTLNNVPVPEDRPSIEDVGWARKVFGYSYLVDWSMRELGHGDVWYLGNWPITFVYRDDDRAAQIGCRLIQRLKQTLDRDSIWGVLVAEYAGHVATGPRNNPFLTPIKTVVACAKAAGFIMVDTFEPFRAFHKKDPQGFRNLYVQVHLSEAGNDYVARLILQALKTHEYRLNQRK